MVADEIVQGDKYIIYPLFDSYLIFNKLSLLCTHDIQLKVCDQREYSV